MQVHNWKKWKIVIKEVEEKDKIIVCLNKYI